MRIGVVGTSYWTEHVHGAGAAAHPDWELVAVWGRSAEKAEAVAGVLGCAAQTDYDTFLDQVDAVAFAVPPDVQAPMGLEAARRGKHLLLEKPLALDAAQADELADAVDGAGVADVVFFTTRWIPDLSANLDRIAEQGGWESGSFSFVASLPEAMLEASPWRARWGALWDVGPHVLSVLERVLGEVTEVHALAGARDHLQLSFRHASGATSGAEVTLTAPAAAVRNRVGFWGEHGHADPMESAAAPGESVGLAYAAALTDLREQVTTGRRGSRASARYGAHVVHVLAAAQRSVASGTTERC